MAGEELCGQCRLQREQFGDRLADRVFILTYAQGYHRQGIHQSAYTLRSYKDPVPVPEAQQNLQLLAAVASIIHGPCMQAHSERPWRAVTFVPSIRHPDRTHPVADIARQVRQVPEFDRLLLALGPGAADATRTIRDDRFIVPTEYRDRVLGRHVLVVDDTWTTGSKMQSAAIALKTAGAAEVTGLCLARWCRWDWPDHAALLETLKTPYDALFCPAQHAICDRALTT